MLHTNDGPPTDWAGCMADPVVLAAEARAARATMDLRRAFEILAENARLERENTELRTRLRFHGVEGY